MQNAAAYSHVGPNGLFNLPPGSEMVVLVAMFAAIALVLVHLFRLAQAAITHSTIRQLIDKDPARAEALIEQVTARRPSGNDRTAVVLIAIGISMILASWIAGDAGWMRYGVAGGLFPMITGVSLLVSDLIRRRASVSEPK
jgi:uncharacterized membrane protein